MIKTAMASGVVAVLTCIMLVTMLTPHPPKEPPLPLPTSDLPKVLSEVVLCREGVEYLLLYRGSWGQLIQLTNSAGQPITC